MLDRLGVPSHKLVLLGNGVDLQRFRPEADGASRRQARADLGIDEQRRGGGDGGASRVAEGLPRALRGGRAASARRIPRSSSSSSEDQIPTRPMPSHPRSSPPPVAVGASSSPATGTRWSASTRPSTSSCCRRTVKASRDRPWKRRPCGLPVIATDIRGCRQVVTHGQSGLLVPLHDPARLADGNRGAGGRPRTPPAHGRGRPAQSRGRVRRPGGGVQDDRRLRTGARPATSSTRRRTPWSARRPS